jgi:hypothetical protein
VTLSHYKRAPLPADLKKSEKLKTRKSISRFAISGCRFCTSRTPRTPFRDNKSRSWTKSHVVATRAGRHRPHPRHWEALANAGGSFG